MAEEDWVLDSVVGFLHSPIWRVPILSFIEQKCIVFNPEEEKSAYTEIHDEYSSLVELLLESFLEDLGINAVSFVKVCDAFKSKNPQATVTVLEQVYAAQGFEVFKAMMTQKNIELELQALSMLQQRSGQIPDIMQPKEKTSSSQATEDTEEERILQEVMKKSKEEHDQMLKSKKQAGYVNEAMEKSLATGKEVEQLKIQQQKEEEVLQMTLKLAISEGVSSTIAANSSKSSKRDSGANSKLPSVTRDPKSAATSSKSPKPSSTSSKSPIPSTTSSKSPTPFIASTKSSKPVSGQEAAANWLLSAKAEAAESSGRADSRISNLSNADPSDIEKRAQYLKQQRDMLIAKKRSAREKSLDAYEKSQPTARPKSSQAARQATQGSVKLENPVDEKKLAMRKALATCLKNEVIAKK